MQKTNMRFYSPNNAFYFSYQKKSGYYTMPSNHFHNKYELYYLISGERYYFIKDKTIHVQPGNLVLINKDELHKTIDAGAQTHTRIVINFDTNFILSSPHMDNLLKKLFDSNNYIIPFLPTNQQDVELFFNRMFSEIQHQPLGYEISLQLLLMELIIYTSRYLAKNPSNILANLTPMHKKISEIVQFINSNFSQSLSLSSISQKFFISQYYLSRTFKEVTGFTFIEYLSSIRIREAQYLLLETNYNITMISEKVGFESPSHFGRVFKSITNISPMAYRKQHRL